MTFTLAVYQKGDVEVTCEYEQYTFHARVYEKYGGEWHRTHESWPYVDRDDAMKAYKRFKRRYCQCM